MHLVIYWQVVTIIYFLLCSMSSGFIQGNPALLNELVIAIFISLASSGLNIEQETVAYVLKSG